jgi:predicted short-subunit dehydrogenase-like oxidoreductase (DUF2520 family)
VASSLNLLFCRNMSAKRSKPQKPNITIVGAGNLARALAASLCKAEYKIDQVISRDNVASLRRAKQLAAKVRAIAVTASNARIDSTIVWFCVPDGAIATVATSLRAAAEWFGKIALHSSGVLSSQELQPLRQYGAGAASAHPFMTFVRGSEPRLQGVPFAIEGDARALRAARRIVKDLGGTAYPIHPEEKAAYHAWGTFSSPLFTALLAITEQVAAEAGISKKSARSRMLPILQQTLENYSALGPDGALSGPLVRGDIGTVKRHLDILRKVPLARETYLPLARAALAYLPAKNRRELEEVLYSDQSLRTQNRTRRQNQQTKHDRGE